MAISAVILGKRLRKVRNAKKFTQEYIAEMVDLTPEHISRIENGKNGIYLHKLALWCDVLDVPIEQILTGAAMPANPAYNRQFGEIAEGCSEEAVCAMLDICRRIAEVERKAKQNAEE